MKKKIFFTLMLSALSQGAVLADTMGGSNAQSPQSISTLNDSFRQSYSLAKESIRKNLGPVIIANAGDLILLYRGKREAKPCVPEDYTILKTVDHIPLGIFVILNDHFDAPLDSSIKERLLAFKALASKAAEDVAAAKLSAGTQARQTTIITRSQTFIDNVLSRGSLSQNDLRQFTTASSRDTLLNADEAMADQFVMMDKIINDWRKKLSADEFKQTNYIIMSGHMPRLQNSNLQYFEKITGEKQEGQHIIYAEGLSEEDKAIDLLVTHILDRQIALDFYHDPWRMHRDLLSDSASKYLSKHKPLSH